MFLELDDEEEPWLWKPNSSGMPIKAAENIPIFPRQRGRRHSFPPPYIYSVKNAPRWGILLPHKTYTIGMAYKSESRLSYDRLLPDGRVFIPLERYGSARHSFNINKKCPVTFRRMSGSLEGLVADSDTARNPAYVTPYRAPHDPITVFPSTD